MVKIVQRAEARSELYDHLLETAPTVKNDCAVKAIAIIADADYATAHAAAVECGFTPRVGMYWQHTINCLEEKFGIEGHTVTNDFITTMRTQLRVQKNYIIKNVTTRQLSMFPDLLPNGTFLIGTYGHILAVKNGEVQDYAKRHAYHINRVFKVVDR